MYNPETVFQVVLKMKSSALKNCARKSPKPQRRVSSSFAGETIFS
jgi:hypothetical protein